jgi:hypothetical protein
MCEHDYCEYTANNCSELLQTLLDAEICEHPFPGIYFQGDAIVAKKIVCLEDLKGGETVYSKKFNRTLIVGPRRDRWFLLCLYGETPDMEITIGIDVPAYCRNEMIATIKGEW